MYLVFVFLLESFLSSLVFLLIGPFVLDQILADSKNKLILLFRLEVGACAVGNFGVQYLAISSPGTIDSWDNVPCGGKFGKLSRQVFDGSMLAWN